MNDQKLNAIISMSRDFFWRAEMEAWQFEYVIQALEVAEIIDEETASNARDFKIDIFFPDGVEAHEEGEKEKQAMFVRLREKWALEEAQALATKEVKI